MNRSSISNDDAKKETVLTDSGFMRRVSTTVLCILLCLVGMAVSAYALFGYDIQIQTTVKTFNYGLHFEFDGISGDYYMGGDAFTRSFDETDSGVHTLRISLLSEENIAESGFCRIIVNDKDSNGDTRTRKYYTDQLGIGGSNSYELSFDVIGAGSITAEPHWGTWRNYGYLNEEIAADNSTLLIGSVMQRGRNVVSYTTFTSVFSNIDKYIYRVGNGNAVKLGSLFDVAAEGTAPVDPEKVYITVEAVSFGSETSAEETGSSDTGSGKCAYKVNASDWKESTLQFDGTGPVKVTVREGTGDAFSMYLEVVNGVNVVDYPELSASRSDENSEPAENNQNIGDSEGSDSTGNTDKNANSGSEKEISEKTCRNIVLLKDIKMIGEESGQIFFKDNTVFGNGFIIDVSEGTIKGDDASENALVVLESSVLNNVQVVGGSGSPTEETETSYADAAAVLTKGECVIANSFVSNCSSAVRAFSGKLTIVNSTLKGGSFANLDVRNAYVTVDGLTTVNQSAGDGDTEAVGLGIVINNDGVSESSLKVEGPLKQYNFIKSTDTVREPLASLMIDKLFACTDFVTVTDEVSVLNTGILCLSPDPEKVFADLGDGLENYAETDVILDLPGSREIEAKFLSIKSPVSEEPDSDYVPAAQYGFISSNSFNVSSGDYDGEKIRLSFVEGETIKWNADCLMVKCDGCVIEVNTVIDGEAEFNEATKEITFPGEGDYTLTYSYSIPEYKLSNGEIEKISNDFSISFPLTVSVNRIQNLD